MSLGGGERPPNDDQGMSDTYCLILTTHILTTFQLVAINVGGGCVGVCNTTLDLGDDGGGYPNHHGKRWERYYLHLECQKRLDVRPPRVHSGSGNLAALMHEWRNAR